MDRGGDANGPLRLVGSQPDWQRAHPPGPTAFGSRRFDPHCRHRRASRSESLQWVFVMNGHGAPTHHVAVNEACDFVSETFKATMLNVSGLFNADAAIQEKGARLAARYFSPANLSAFGRDVHGGCSGDIGDTRRSPRPCPAELHGLTELPGGRPERGAHDCTATRMAGVLLGAVESQRRLRSRHRGLVGGGDDRFHSSGRPR